MTSIVVGLLRSPQCKRQQFCCEALHHGNFDSTGHDVLCECALLFSFSSFPEQTMCIPPVADQDLHVTLSEARIREDGHQARIVRSQQLTNQTVNIPQHTELGQILVERSATQGISPSDESENSTSHSAASTAPRAFASTYEKAATPRHPPL